MRRKRPPTQDQLAAPKRPSGTAYPTIGALTSKDAGVPVVLTWRTILKIIGPSVAVVLGGASAAAYSHHRATAHLENTAAHLSPRDRVELVTQRQARAAYQALLDRIDAGSGRTRIELREQIQKLGDDIKADQRRQLRRAIRELQGEP